MTRRKALITGATGVVGRYLLIHLLETSKARRFGFHKCVEMFLRLFTEFRRNRVIP